MRWPQRPVAEKVVRLAGCPVLVLRAQPKVTQQTPSQNADSFVAR